MTKDEILRFNQCLRQNAFWDGVGHELPIFMFGYRINDEDYGNCLAMRVTNDESCEETLFDISVWFYQTQGKDWFTLGIEEVERDYPELFDKISERIGF